MRYSLHALYLKSKYFAIHFKHRHIMWQSDRRTYIKVSTKKQISLEKSLPFDTLARERITRRGSNPINASLYLTTQTECLLFKQHPNDFIHTARDLWMQYVYITKFTCKIFTVDHVKVMGIVPTSMMIHRLGNFVHTFYLLCRLGPAFHAFWS